LTTTRGVSPTVVALLRGIAEAAVLAVLGVIIVALGEVTTGELAPWAPIGLLGLRQLEGLLDKSIDPTRQRLVGGKAAR
jgi:hypothetical protein